MRLERKNGHAFAVCAVSRRTSSQIFANGMPRPRNRANRKKRRQAKGCGLPLPPTLSDCAGTQFKVGSKLLLVAKQTSQHPPSPNLLSNPFLLFYPPFLLNGCWASRAVR